MNIVEYDEFKSKIATVKDQCDFIPDCSNDEGYQKSKRIALDVGKILTSLEKVRKEKKAYFLEGGKQVDKQAKEIAEQLQSFQLPHKKAYKELDDLKKQVEKERKDNLESRVSRIYQMPENLSESSSNEIKEALEELNNELCEDFYEYTKAALDARKSSIEKLTRMFANTLNAEKEAEELRVLREKQAAQEKKEREDRIRKEASEKAEAEKKAAIEREMQAKQAAIEAEKAKVEAENKALEQARLAEIRRVEAEAKAKSDAEEAAKKAAEQGRLAEIERQKQEQERLAEENRKREENKKHVAKIRGESKNALIDIGLSEELAKKVVIAIHDNKIPNIFINY